MRFIWQQVLISQFSLQNLPVSSYSHLPTPESVIYYEDPEADEDFLVTHRSPRLEDEKSSTSEGCTSHHSEYIPCL